MTRYLLPPFIQSALNRGHAVEQFLGGFEYEGSPALRWLTLQPEEDGVTLLVYESYDEGGEDFLDLYAFSEIDGEQGDSAAEHPCATLDEALTLARTRYGADPERWVNEGVVQDEYQDYLTRGRR